MNRILMVDDDLRFLEVYSEILRNSGYDTDTAESGEQALSLLGSKYYNIAIVDVLMPRMNGIEFIKKIKERCPEIIVLMLTGEGSIQGAVKSMELGAFTYMLKPIEPEELLYHIKRAEAVFLLKSENISLKNSMENRKRSYELIGNSLYLNKLRGDIQLLGKTSSTVLITGESGTGKELIANIIHQNSQRKKGPFVAVNCGAIPENLVESELFGYEKGAFTGALKQKIGKFELSNGGTLFLDEIGDMPLNAQTKLLRVLQERCFERVGGNDLIHSDFRLICATNKDLLAEIKNGNFREDLFYRINIVPINVLPIRERREDILDLFESFYGQFCAEMNKKRAILTEDAKIVLQNYSWKGNGREIKNVAERIAVFSDGTPITRERIQAYLSCNMERASLGEMNLKEAEEAFEKEYIMKHLTNNDFNVAKTAEQLGITRQTLYNKIEKYGFIL